MRLLLVMQRYLALSPGPIAVNCLSFNASGDTLLTGAADGIMRLYGMSSAGAHI